ncbi:MAG: efflux RND transporter periplasmic adaptor subunit, partial [Gemmatimonadetes bacterium]|nr:efflux RND transporter periplasmic adaptor subunit [Gemmatimonadota bacterium]
GRLDGAAPLLGDGYRVEARLVLASRRGVVVVPSGALVSENQAWSVFRVAAGRAARRALRVGARGGDRAEVLDGVVAGDTVVVFPPDKLTDGALVRRVHP